MSTRTAWTALADDALRASSTGPSSAGELFEGGGFAQRPPQLLPGRGRRGSCTTTSSTTAIVDLVRAIRPDIVDSVRATLNFNLPGSVAQHYHMDGLYLKDFLICNVAVVDTDLENGAIDVLPGTNREFYKFWRYAAASASTG